jgi:DNA ligase-1
VRRLADALERARMSRSRIGKEKVLAEALAMIARDPADVDGIALATAARLAVGRTLPVGDDRSLGAGFSLLLEAGAAMSGFSEAIVGASARVTGDLGEALGLLVARVDGAQDRPGIPLWDVASLFGALASARSRLAKRRVLDPLFARATPLEIKYVAKALLGSLRVGAQAGVMEGALARAFEAPLEAVRRAIALETDVGEVAILAKAGKLDDAHLEPGRPVAFMLASPIETVATAVDPSSLVMEDKIDGVRAQIHKHGAEVAIFARGLDRTTTAFPEIVDAFQFVPGGVVLDGEIVALAEDGRPRPFQALQARLRRLKPSAAMIQETPVALVAYDLLHDGETDVLAFPWHERRSRLEVFARERAPKTAFLLHPASALPLASGAVATPLHAKELLTLLDVPFAAARARGFEGLVLKRTDAPYDAGRRGQAWLKVKRAFATLDVVITAAEQGHGRRAGVLSDYTFGVWSGEAIVNVGKAYSGLSDDEIDALGRRLESLTAERLGGLRAIRPAVVLEVAFDGVQPSSRHESGFALRFPRIVRVRDDKKPEEADHLEDVEALFRMQVETRHREDSRKAPGAARSRKAREDRQLTLFDVDPVKRPE